MHLKPTYPVETARLELRPLAHTDIDELLTYRGRADVCRFLPFEPMTRDVLRARIDADLGRPWITDEGQSLTLGVRVRDSGRLVGDVVLFFRSREDATGEIGYVFHPDVGGRGYAREACSALLDLAFHQLGLHRVFARLDSRNEASARLAARLGMRREAHFVRSVWAKGEWVDQLVFAVLAEEWAGAVTPG
ncbi:GNAT family N-acetyltransferase [Pseudonocardia lacus]|uniref:GNAT family N-acetyltransferase n=1 Tax=Pseudonocardia lacus TaxID=2835865 RepID=UPI001BDC16F7|nr:GNAT family protein [Pseudonocardia lacus]